MQDAAVPISQDDGVSGKTFLRNQKTPHKERRREQKE